MKKYLLIIGLTFLFIIFLSGVASAANITVTPTSGLKNAITKAHNGDTLNLSAGTYNEYNLILNKNLTISGPQTSSTPKAVIDAQKLGKIFSISNDANVTLKYLTITNGSGSYGGGVRNDGTLTIINCYIQKNTADGYGGGIYNYKGNLTVTGCNIQENTAANSSGGIHNEGTCIITSSNFKNNTGDYGGGIYNLEIITVTSCYVTDNNAKNDGGGIYNFGTCTITNSTINYNTATNTNSSMGGGIENAYGTCIITGSNILNNNASFGGGGLDNWMGNLTLSNSTIKYNTARVSGGGLYIEYNKLTVINSTINNNTATNSMGGGIYIGQCNVSITNSSILLNTANKSGGGIENAYGTCIITGSNILNNNASFGGGGLDNWMGNLTLSNSTIKYNTASFNGGGLCTEYNNLNVINSSINYNIANGYGGGIYIGQSNVSINNSSILLNTANKSGGGINNYKGNLTVTGCNIQKNTAIDGGGIINSGNCTIIGSNIKNNTANKGGGGIANWDKLIIKECNFEFNKATFGNAVYNYGGAASTRILNFNRFYDLSKGYEIYSNNGSIDAKYNWWASNLDPHSKVFVYNGTVLTNQWLVLKIITSMTTIGKNCTSTITAYLTYDSVGVYHNPAYGHVINGLPVSFKTTLGAINSSVTTVNGVAIAILTCGLVSGTTDVSTTLDSQIMHNYVKIDVLAPIVKCIDPVNGAINVARDKMIKVTFNEAINAGSMWIELKNNAGSIISITTNIIGNILTVTPKNPLNESKYTLEFHTGCIKNLAGNPLAYQNSKFSTGTPPTVTSINPVSGTVNIHRNKAITVTFNEPIKAGSMWIELKGSNGTTIKVYRIISGNILTIKPATLLAANTRYTLILHTGCVTDLAGNPLAIRSFNFTTGSV